MVSSMLAAVPLLSFLVASVSCSSVGTTYAFPKQPASNIRIGHTIASGMKYQAGFLNDNVRYQASGVLTKGGCLRPGQVLPRSCYQMTLSAQGNLEAGNNTAAQKRDVSDGVPGERDAWSLADDNLTPAERATIDDFALDDYFEAFPEQAIHRYGQVVNAADSRLLKRQAPPCGSNGTTSASVEDTSRTGIQRNELFTWPGAMYNETWNYTWKSWLRTGVSTSAHFFHSWQILRRDSCGGPVVTLDWKAGQAVITDTVRGCTSCVKVQIRPFSSTMIFHNLTVTYGLQGSIDYVCTARDGNTTLIAYHSHNRDMGNSASLKMGSYRLVIPEALPTAADVADFVGVRIA